MRGMNNGSEGRTALEKAVRPFFCTVAGIVAIWTCAGMECAGREIPGIRRNAPQKLWQDPQGWQSERRQTERRKRRWRNRQAEEVPAGWPADWLEEMLEEMCEEGREEEAAAAYEYFEQLVRDPLNINRAGRSDLERMMILTDFQIESLLEYRRDHGDILSGAELSLLNGFTEDIVRRLRPFVVFAPGGAGKASGGSFFEKCRSELLAKMRWVQEEKMKPEYLGAPYYMQLRYKCTYSDKIRLGVTLENDAGEPFIGPSRIPMGDFFSFHLAFDGIPIDRKKKVMLDNLIIGDFSIRLGQGLTFWNSFSMSVPDDPRGFYKKGSAAVPYTSADENNFLRGVAASFSAGRFSLSVAGSYSRRDATVSENVYTSLITGGLHNTSSALEKRKTLNETVAGLTAHYRFGRFRAGVSAVLYGYDKKNGRIVREYNKYQMYDGMWGNVSADVYGAIGRVRMFGEFALDLGGRPAVLLGAVFPVGEKCEAGILARSYSKAYIAPHAGAYHTGSGCFNQSGISVNAALRLNWNLKLVVNADAVHYPWLRYNIGAPSNAVRGSVKLAYEDRQTSWQIRLVDHYQDHSQSNRASLRGRIRRKIGERFLWGCRMEAVFASGAAASGAEKKEGSTGWMACIETGYESAGKKFRIAAQGAWFCAPVWDSRLYLYENDLPQTFGSRLLYGKGFCGYLLARYRIFHRTEIYTKLDSMVYSRSGKDTDGKNRSGLSRISLGLRLRF